MNRLKTFIVNHWVLGIVGLIVLAKVATKWLKNEPKLNPNCGCKGKDNR